MTFTAFVLILFSVTFHASWNMIAKKQSMSIAFYTILCTAAMLCSHNVLYWTPVKYLTLPPVFYLCLTGSVLSDCTYCLGLVHSYRRMDMSVAYPLMRSLPLLLTIAVTAALQLGSPLSWYAVCGALITFAGCLLVPLKKFQDFNWEYYFSSGIIFVLIAAAGTTGYTIFDSQAQKIMIASAQDQNISKTVVALSYYAIRGVVLSSALTLLTMVIPQERANWFGFWKRRDYFPLLGGVAAALAYSTVLIAMNFVTNVTYVQMLRLLALPFGVFTGIFFLKERGTAPKFIGVTMIIAGMLFVTL